MKIDLTAADLALVLDALDELSARDPDGILLRSELARALAARLRLAPAEPAPHRATVDREDAVREVFRLAADILLDVADERPLTEREFGVLDALSPELARRVRHHN